jgi:hypothetical protein
VSCRSPLGGIGAGASDFAVLEAIADYQTPLLIASAVLVGIAWCIHFGRRGAIGTVIALSIATVLVGTAAAWSHLERPLLQVIRKAR